ncbi:hypothetical protein [Streptomyces sp. SID3343]|uniref:hypothetical protein n=1 Tax=Streptomyces sp. SID3343 TaxID=2690260 RepID=UPI00136F8A24|nr:hypothetical protein [Streptomyces sp. SID3343]MYW02811.1 hypothetical protein [Streptomyces sp. SID3343]
MNDHVVSPPDRSNTKHPHRHGAAFAALRDPDQVTRLSRPELDALQALGMEWQPGLTAPAPPTELHGTRPTPAGMRPRTQPRY